MTKECYNIVVLITQIRLGEVNSIFSFFLSHSHSHAMMIFFWIIIQLKVLYLIMSDLAQDSSLHCAASIIKLNSCWNSNLVSGSFCILVVYFLCTFLKRTEPPLLFILNCILFIYYFIISFISFSIFNSRQMLLNEWISTRYSECRRFDRN